MRSQLNTASKKLAKELVQLAAEQSSDKRLKLLRHITDAYLVSDEQSFPAAHYLFDELVARILEAIGVHDRAQASTHFSAMAKIPNSMAHRLATDEDINVASPMVENYHGLSEETLLAVATKGSQDHLRSIANRSAVHPPVSDIVVERGDEKTVRKIAGHQRAKFSSRGMRTLARKSEKDAELQYLLVDRADLSLEAIGILLPMVSHELADRLHDRPIVADRVVIGSRISEWMKERSKNISRTNARINGIREGRLRLEDVVRDALRARQLFGAVSVFAGVMNLDPSRAFGLFAEGSAETTLLLLRSIEVAWPLVEGFLRLKKEKMENLPDDPVNQEDYELIDIIAAQRVVRFMKVRRVAHGHSPHPPHVSGHHH